MSAIAANLYARLGNCMFVWAHAKKRAENEGHELHTAPWAGEKIFTLDGHPCGRPDGHEVETLSGYFQAQKDLIYTRADCRRWFKLIPEIERALPQTPHWPHAHFRRGDYAGAGYPLVSRQSVDAAVAEHQFPGELRKNMKPGEEYIAVSDENPTLHPAFVGDLEILPDFYRLMKAPVLYRANSTFSYWAGVLSYGRVLSPRIDGLKGGIEHDNVPYEEGNHCRCADLAFVTDLHLTE